MKRYDPMWDIEQIQSYYLDSDGWFLVLANESEIVGTGAIRKLDNEICELKRMWLRKEYRGQGWGTKIAQQLFKCAKTRGYRRVRLDIFDGDRQLPALKLYQKLGFYRIERYNDSHCTIFMEMEL